MINSTLDNDYHTSNELKIDPASRAFLKETAKWGKFLAIVGFIGIVLLVLIGIFMGTIFSSLGADMGNQFSGFPMWIMSGLYIAMALFYIMPMLYLYKFSTKAQIALDNDNQVEMTSSFENLKSLFKFIGIFTLIILGFYVLTLLGSVIFGAML